MHLLYFLALLLASLVESQNKCQKLDGFWTCHRKYQSSTALSYVAKVDCEERGFELVTISSENEFNVVVGIMAQCMTCTRFYDRQETNKLAFLIRI